MYTSAQRPYENNIGQKKMGFKFIVARLIFKMFQINLDWTHIDTCIAKSIKRILNSCLHPNKDQMQLTFKSEVKDGELMQQDEKLNQSIQIWHRVLLATNQLNNYI